MLPSVWSRLLLNGPQAIIIVPVTVFKIAFDDACQTLNKRVRRPRGFGLQTAYAETFDIVQHHQPEGQAGQDAMNLLRQVRIPAPQIFHGSADPVFGRPIGIAGASCDMVQHEIGKGLATCLVGIAGDEKEDHATHLRRQVVFLKHALRCRKRLTEILAKVQKEIVTVLKLGLTAPEPRHRSAGERCNDGDDTEDSWINVSHHDDPFRAPFLTRFVRYWSRRYQLHLSINALFYAGSPQPLPLSVPLITRFLSISRLLQRPPPFQQQERTISLSRSP